MRSLGSPGALTGGVSPQRAEDGFSEAVTAGRQGRPERCRTPQESADVSALDKLCDPRRSAMVVAAGAVAGGGVAGGEPVQASSAFDMASLVLYGSQAVPVRLKILLDRLLSVLPHDDVIRVLHGFGWTYEDYVRGYILQDTHGIVLERWSLASRDEEPLIIQQFLRFAETRALAHHFLTSDAAPLASPVDGPPPCQPDSDIKKFLERSCRSGVVPPKPSSLSLFGGKFTTSSGDTSLLSSRGTMSVNRGPSLRHHHHHHHPPSSVSSGHSASPPAVGCSPAASPLTALSSSSPLNKLQSMQPYDFRQADRRPASPDAAGSCVTDSARGAGATLMPVHHHHTQHNNNNNNNNNNSSSSPKTPLSSPTHNHNSFSAPFPNHSSDLSVSEGPSEDETGDAGAINLSLGVGSMDSVYAARKVKHLRKSANPMKRRWNPMVLSTLTTNPATGKRRVQCHVCLKTFCDKGALKIHFSAVHLREMHKCTVEGCNMMFSSRRSRNRHSANPNPKLHTPNLRRKISPHDGRTANPFPLLPPSTLLNFNNANATGIVPPSSLASALHDKLGAVQEKLASLCSTQSMMGAGGPLPGDCALRLTTFRKSKHEERAPSVERPVDRSPRRRDIGGVNLSLEKEDKVTQSRPSPPVLGENKGVRKRKALNPTKVAAVTSDDDLQYATSDESSSNTYIDQNGLMEESKSDDDMDDVDDISTDGQDDSKDFDVDDDLDDKDTDGHMTPSPPPIKFKTEREVPHWNFEVEQGKIGGAVSIKKENEKPETIPSSNNEPRASPVVTKRDSSVEDLSTKKDGERMSPAASVKTEDVAENPLRHLESLSLGAFAGLVPTAPRSLSSGGVSFHAPGLGLADVPRDVHDPCLRDCSPPSSDQHMSSLLPVYRDAALVGPGLEIPVDKENPRRCTACGKVFQNHFGVKTHYQNVHLKLMHKCTVEGCNAAFPSKRSRDRHSANLNLHRKLLSTSSSEKGGASPFLDKALFPYPPSDFFTRLYDPQGLPLNLADVYHRLPEGFALPPSFAMGPFHPLLAPPPPSTTGADDDDDDSRQGSRGAMSPASSGGGGVGDSRSASSPPPQRGACHDDEDIATEDRASSPVDETPVVVAAT
ncbi:zinc finger protein basonuclin-1-like isoform X2 [Dermacentor andersoni]|uniref:zinc finger protein basonuclin-1-like isoform X2 n=1 Tax=Dermacentor andersoni TaxID=34620 RepID=UPI003B39FA95